MPSKPSSPTKTRTLNTFFSIDGSSSSNAADDTAKSEAQRSKRTDANPGTNAISPGKAKPRKRASKAKEKDVANNTQSVTATTDTPIQGSDAPKAKAKSKGKHGSKKESVTGVIIPLAPKINNNAVSGSIINNNDPSMDSSPSLSLANAKEAAPPNKLDANDTTIASATTATSSTNLNKLNKIDSASMFKVRNGKAYITETKLKFYSHPAAVADLCKFHEYRESLRQAQDLTQSPGTKLEADHVEITDIPSEHLGLIAKLVEESELLLVEMASCFMTTLCPLGFEAFEDFATSLSIQDGDESMQVDTDISVEKKAHIRRSGTTVSAAAIMEAVQKVAQRVNYGIPVSNLPGPAVVTPANLSVFRWEVQDIDRYFPSDMKAAVIKRRKKRMEASAALTAWFLGLDAKQQEDLCPIPVTAVRVPGIEGELPGASQSNFLSVPSESMEVDGDAKRLTGVAADVDGTTRSGAVVLLNGQPTVEAAVDPAVIESKLREAEAKKKEAEAKEERRLEKERKMAERQLEKDTKEAERLQREEAKKRKAEEERLKKEQTSLRFVGFFKPAATPTVKKDNTQSYTGDDSSLPPPMELFHPFHIKKNTTLAPINRFTNGQSIEEIDQALNLGTKRVMDKDGDSDMDVDMDESYVPVLGRAEARARLSAIFSKHRQSTDQNAFQRRRRLPANLKSMTVTEVVQSGLLLQDQDDDQSYALTWKDIPALRMRLFQFAENYRPAYYGTWSKRSRNITGRRFLGKDTELVDYAFDSEAEWEEDEEGEECKSDDDEEDADELGSEVEEEDDWLVPEGYLSDDEGLDAGEEGGSKSEHSQKKTKELRRPTLAHATPVIIGPVFEVTLGEYSSHPALEQYHVEFLGDYGIGMDMYHATESSMLVTPLPSEIPI
ncbi:Chromatin assembly factor 1, subunit A [Haplosporangium sp. Z 11]|nr:Chromatin assembly factor 1, subunit A [Haplosporangium sp. Z 11]